MAALRARVGLRPEALRPTVALRADHVHVRQPARPGAGRAARARRLREPAFTIEKLNRAIADVINAYLDLDLAKVWGDASSVAADGTQMDTLIDNLLAEQHIRYGGYGGIAYHHVADNYIALFSRFIPCGVWEAVYISEAPQAALRRGPGHDPRRHPRPELPGARARAPVRVRATVQDPQLEGADLLPARARQPLPAHRLALWRAWPERDRLAADRKSLAGSDADRALDPRKPTVLDPAAAQARDRVAQEQRLQGVPRARPRDPHDHAAAVHLRARARAARADHRRDQTRSSPTTPTPAGWASGAR